MDLFQNQRWHTWKNCDETPCPSFGVVEIFDYETAGNEIVLLGRSSECFKKTGPPVIETIDTPNSNGESIREYLDPNHFEYSQGLYWNHGYNGAASVSPNQTGHLTFDFPAFVRVSNLKESTSNFRMLNGVFLSQGNFAGSIRGFQGLFQFLAGPEIVLGKPWHLGAFGNPNFTGGTAPFDWRLNGSRSDGGAIQMLSKMPGDDTIALAGGCVTFDLGANLRFQPGDDNYVDIYDSMSGDNYFLLFG